jgi:hypothetical protein
MHVSPHPEVLLGLESYSFQHRRFQEIFWLDEHRILTFLLKIVIRIFLDKAGVDYDVDNDKLQRTIEWRF